MVVVDDFAVVPGLSIEIVVGVGIAAEVETADSGDDGIGNFEAEIGDSVEAVGYPEIQFASGIGSPAGPDPIVQPWW